MIHAQLLPLLAAFASLFGPPEAALRTQSLPLPGPPSVIVPADVDGDGRPDLAALTADFSMFQALKVLTVQRLSVQLDFHVWCQKPDGSFQAVRGLDLSGTLNLDLRNVRPGQLSQFSGDFDGDGRPDFLQLGRGKEATVHRGRADCSFDPARGAAPGLEPRPGPPLPASKPVSVNASLGSEGAVVESRRNHPLELIDLDGDGRPEIVVIVRDDGGRGRVTVVRVGG